MKIAIPTDGTEVAPHFGRSPSFTIAAIDGDEVTGKEVIDNPGHEPGLIPEFLKGKGVNMIIASGMGQRARDLFESAGIDHILGVEGEINTVINTFLKGELKGSESNCDHGSGKGYGIDKTECDHKD